MDTYVVSARGIIGLQCGARPATLERFSIGFDGGGAAWCGMRVRYSETADCCMPQARIRALGGLISLDKSETVVHATQSSRWRALCRLGLVRKSSVIPAEQSREDVVAARAAYGVS